MTILSAAFDDLESLSELFAAADPPTTAPAAPAKPVANTTHKRQLSEAIPGMNAPMPLMTPLMKAQRRRLNRRNRRRRMPRKEGQVLGKSGRAPKPKKRN